MTPAIEVRGLAKNYGSKAALRGLNLHVPQGSFFGFLGPNGAGKTTTIHILIGLLPATSGSAEVLGMKVPQELTAIKRKIGVVPDESVLFDRLTGLEFLEFVFSILQRIARNFTGEASPPLTMSPCLWAA